MLQRLFRVRIAVRVHPRYVELACTGIYSRAEALRVGNEGYRQAAHENRSALLIDVRKITGRLPTVLDRYDFGVHISEQYLTSDPRVRLAEVGNEPMIHPDRFGELVARNRGADARVFTDEALAVDWLLERPA